ncbi:serine hydrolase domain-containing protein [Pseudoduganella armeniaca]|uniref:Beta-lactamase-related domain-containing protein n=1 Tax=Pseudoduganella armeniaca TaxID=2072590 RepID=A0A2R4CCT0_9BURK|nr:serine hydrolase domain-containing protein [Pseudoduganella armeniaca]AVR97298.1 hypothetical protein C9I28_17845 [Pseudoduganella armeniaca]
MSRRRLLQLLALAAASAGCAPLPRGAVAQPGAGFNGVLLVRRNGSAAPAVTAHGLAEADGRANTAATRFQIGSISKWVTSVAILRLVEQGRLALDVPVARWLPSLPAATGQAVTLRHLMSNASGIPNGVMQAYKADKAIADLPLTPLQATLRFAAAPLAFTPGSRFDYSLTNWVVLAAIVEQATGKPFRAVVTELVLQPAGTRDTGFADAGFGGAGEAVAYAAPAAGQAAQRKMSPTPAYAAASGSLYSTAADLALLARQVYDGGLLAPASLAELGKVQVAEEDYALGGRVKRVALGGRERMVVWLTGAVGGYKSLLAYVPGDGATVALLENMDPAQSAQAATALRLLGELYA